MWPFAKAQECVATLKRQFDIYSCRREYADAQDPENPFGSPKE